MSLLYLLHFTVHAYSLYKHAYCTMCNALMCIDSNSDSGFFSFNFLFVLTVIEINYTLNYQY